MGNWRVIASSRAGVQKATSTRPPAAHAIPVPDGQDKLWPVRVPTLRPMLASSATHLPTAAGWSYEVKWDGFRTLALKDGSRIKLLSRNLKDATRLYPTVAREVARLDVESVLLDGEVVAIDDQGRPSFQALHHQSAHSLVYYAFDLLHLDGRDLTATPLDERRDLLARVLNGSRLLRSEPLPGTPAQIDWPTPMGIYGSKKR
jgi:bifunctional non-homologous end joining protein LigD